jgi:hypothetical protein
MSTDISESISTASQRLARAAEWDRELADRAAPAPLHQSWAWGEVQRRVSWPPERVHLNDGGRAQVLLRGPLNFQWGYVPRGPVPATMPAITELVGWARRRGLTMLRVEPEGPAELASNLALSGFRRGPLVEARRTAIVALQDDQAMLDSFRKSTRYNLRTAERSHVTVEEVATLTELSRQVRLASERHRVYITGSDFHRALIETLPSVRIYEARLGDEVLAAMLVAYHDHRAYYLVAGSSGRHRDTMPNYALQWRAMRDARDAGCADYDLCGLPMLDRPDDPWRNLEQFKTGFGGTIVEYPGAWDIVLSPTRYWFLRRLHRLHLNGKRLVGRARTLAARPV